MAVLTAEDCAASRAPGRLMRRIDKLMSSEVQSTFDGLDLSYLQWVALKVVRDGVAGNAGELARELGITTGATTRMIDAVEKHGLLMRDRTGGDRRVVRLAITDAGRGVVAKFQPRVVSVWNEALRDFSQAEVTTFVDTLLRLLAAAERVAGCAAPAIDPAEAELVR